MAKDETLWLLRMLQSYAELRALKWWCWGRLRGETKILISVFSKKQNPYGGVKDQEIVEISQYEIQNTIPRRYMGLEGRQITDFQLKICDPWRYKVWPKVRFSE